MPQSNFSWSFNIRDSLWSEDDHESMSRQDPSTTSPLLAPYPEDDIDISMREDHAVFKSNPFTIAAINAASRKPRDDELNLNMQRKSPVVQGNSIYLDMKHSQQSGERLQEGDYTDVELDQDCGPIEFHPNVENFEPDLYATQENQVVSGPAVVYETRIPSSSPTTFRDPAHHFYSPRDARISRNIIPKGSVVRTPMACMWRPQASAADDETSLIGHFKISSTSNCIRDQSEDSESGQVFDTSSTPVAAVASNTRSPASPTFERCPASSSPMAARQREDIQPVRNSGLGAHPHRHNYGDTEDANWSTLPMKRPHTSDKWITKRLPVRSSGAFKLPGVPLVEPSKTMASSGIQRYRPPPKAQTGRIAPRPYKSRVGY